MAQRNPMNDRYTGEGPGGQTRKSASSAKPASQAASSVHIRKKPQTAAEKRAAMKAREKEAREKAQEKARKAEEKAKAAAELEAEQAGEGDGEGSDGTVAADDKSTATAGGKAKSTINKIITPDLAQPEKTEEYRKWRRVYWTLVIIGIICIAIFGYFNFFNPGALSPTMTMVILGVAYPAIIGALIVDFRKVKPLMRAQQEASTGNKSPKQLKHEERARQEAAALEAARKAAKAAKRRPRRKERSIVSGDAPDNSTAVPGQDSEVINPGQDPQDIIIR